MSTQLPIDAVRAAWRRRNWLVLPIFLFPLAAATTLILAMPPIYRSGATLMIERQQVPEVFVRATVTEEIGLRLRVISEEALSRSRLQDVISRFNLYPEFRAREAMEDTIARARKDIQIVLSTSLPGVERGSVERSVVAFTVSFRGPDPRIVADVANELASFFVDENLKARERQATGTTKFLEAELAQTKERLDEQERRVSEFNRRHLGELPSQLTANLATLESLNTQLRLTVDSQTRAGERRSTLSQLLAEHTTLLGTRPGATAAAPTVDPIAARLDNLRQELAHARARLVETHPTIQRINGEIEELERQVVKLRPAEPAEKPAEGPRSGSPGLAILQNPQVVRLREQIADIDTHIKALGAQQEQLTKDIAMYRARVENTPRVEQAWQELSRDYSSTKELYQSLLKRHEEARMAENMEQRQKGEQFRLLDPAVPAREVAAPRRGRLLITALAVFGGLAAGVLVLAEKLDGSFHTLDDLRAFTRVPVLASIPRIVTEADRRRRRWRVGLGTVSAAACLLLVVGFSYLVAHGNERLVRMLVQG
jgi:succinoglycan biosynthesis transport protein ExoP